MKCGVLYYARNGTEYKDPFTQSKHFNLTRVEGNLCCAPEFANFWELSIR